jgi:hypothetical protein
MGELESNTLLADLRDSNSGMEMNFNTVAALSLRHPEREYYHLAP